MLQHQFNGLFDIILRQFRYDHVNSIQLCCKVNYAYLSRFSRRQIRFRGSTWNQLRQINGHENSLSDLRLPLRHSVRRILIRCGKAPSHRGPYNLGSLRARIRAIMALAITRDMISAFLQWARAAVTYVRNVSRNLRRTRKRRSQNADRRRKETNA